MAEAKKTDQRIEDPKSIFEKMIGPSIGVAVLGYVFKVGMDFHNGRTKKKNMCNAIVAEIKLNVSELKAFKQAPKGPVLSAVREKQNFIPHVVYARNDSFFAMLASDTTVLPHTVLQPVVAFYNELDFFYAQIDGLKEETFKAISDEGRVKTVSGLWDAAENAVYHGENALRLLKKEIPPIWWKDEDEKYY
ncbi:hypothetical protein V5T82_02120 [Magnetovibrio sp. PR-2]|uniref:hypothetical protein n=1 Tax=Magnetovibrio sp. PR-2 TaxID=3120356 RepID=UPI002FCE0A51